MKKAIFSLLLAGSLILTGCGDSNTDFTQVSGQQGNPGTPVPTPTPTATAGYFVDATNGNDTTAAAAANPTSDTPFATIQAAVTDAPNGTDITIRVGTYTETVTLKNGQRLLGTAGGNRPVISGRIVLADGNTVDFLRIQDSTSDAIDGNDQNGGTITNCQIINATGTGIRLEPAVGSWDIIGNLIEDSGSVGVIADSGGTGSVRYRINDNTITGSGLDAIGLVAENSSQLVAQIHGNTMIDNQDNATFEGIVGDTAVMSLDIEDNTNDDTYVLSNENTGSVLNVEELVVGPPASIPSNTGTVTIDTGTGTAPPTSVADGFCGF